MLSWELYQKNPEIKDIILNLLDSHMPKGQQQQLLALLKEDPNEKETLSGLTQR